ncbi:MAG: ShlB/FhaC/HecB family hemolysin secretion/activation protein, partial [Deltaproteobacteria bacterium]|nr:ShlB/FhaC/HecB family hemolysin secretion/activation protein [Deltaproteobacteria bacterium]
RGLACAALVAALLGSLSAGAPRAAEPALPSSEGDGPVFMVSAFQFEYAEEHADQPEGPSLLPVEVELGRSDSGYTAPHAGVPSERVVIDDDPAAPARPFHATALGAVGQALVQRLHELGLRGVYVLPHPDDIDVDREVDLRPTDHTTLRILATTARVRGIRSVASGDRIKDHWKIDNPAHRRIRENSPIQGADTLREGSTDLLRADILEDYLFQLNRHPGRRVDAALAASEDGQGVDLDFLVSEAKPWFVYAQVGNTGAKTVNPWQTRLGYTNRQLLGRDDIFDFEYLNQGLFGNKSVNAVQGSYDAPWFGKQRARWAKSSPDDPRWISWLNRDKIPWLGTRRLRWRIGGNWSNLKTQSAGSEFKAEDWSLGFRFKYNLWQHRAFFLDLTTGLRTRYLNIKNESLASHTRGYLFLPNIGLYMERFDEVSALMVDYAFEANVISSLRDSQESGSSQNGAIDGTGRLGADEEYQLMRWTSSFSHFLEPLLFRRSWKDPSSPGTSTLAHELAVGFRGQYAFDYALIPQASDVLGGFYSVRGYPQGAAAGDNVAIVNFEYRFHLPRGIGLKREPTRLPAFGSFRFLPQHVYGRADWDFVIRGFVDGGFSKRNATAYEPSHDQTLLGAGAGAELTIRSNLRVRVDWAVALRDLKPSNSSSCTVCKGDDEIYFLFNLLY